jgi:hemoglobin
MARSIFERYGGFAPLSRVVSDFYRKVVDSDILADYFDGVDMRTLIDHQTKFIAQLMGGPASFTDEHIARVHAHLGITDSAFTEMTMLLRETLEDFEFDESDISIVHGQILARKPYIVTVREETWTG